MAVLLAFQYAKQDAPPKGEPHDCDPHICHCKGMQDDYEPYDDPSGEPGLKASTCKRRCVKDACCCPKDKQQ